ncbi:MAG: hypothetical protein F4027_15255 [Rhodospirillaceae bacterium]|nr:hypothetical protein [Rhodospirillaceae bacterium]
MAQTARALPEFQDPFNGPSIGPVAPLNGHEIASPRRPDHERCGAAAGATVSLVLPAPAANAPANDPVAAATAAQVERAARRLAAVDRAEALAATGMYRDAADAAAGAEYGFSGRSVERWRSKVHGRPDRLAALLDAPGRGRKRKRGPEGWDGETAAALWELWRTDYLREEAPPAAAVWRRLAAVAADRGWPLPTLKAFERRTRREFSRAEIVRARTGALACMDTVPAQERTVAGMKPLDIVNGDGRMFDVQVEFPGGRVGRPHVWVWQDVRTRRILAWKIGETEAADLVRASLHDVIVQHGVPGAVLIDNTRAASAKWLTGAQPNRRRWRSTDEDFAGLLQILDIRYIATAVDSDAAGRGKGRGRSKPVERAFLDLSNHIDSHPLFAGAGTGRSPVDRPETHRMRAVPLAEFEAVVSACLAEHNARPGRRTEAAAGRSLDETWNAEIPQAVIRRISAGQEEILLRGAVGSKVGGDGAIRLVAGRGTGLPRNRYHNTALVEYAGKRVTVRFDPDNLHGSVHVYDLEARYLCEAPCLAPVGFADTKAAGEWERARRKARRSAEQTLKAARDMDALTDAMRGLSPPVATPEPEPAAVQLVRHKEAQIPAPAPAEAEAARGEAQNVLDIAVRAAAYTGSLKPKHERFCQHYILTDNAAEAARLAGYSERSARNTGYDLLQRPEVKARVAELQAEHAPALEAREAAREKVRVARMADLKQYLAAKRINEEREWDDRCTA